MKKILIVEDDQDIVRALTLRLKHANYEVIAAFDCVMGTVLASKEQPDLAILDISMPGGDGIVLSNRLQNNTKTIGTPVIFLTASKKPGLREKAMESGAIAFFEKPYDAAELLACVDKALAA